jgi:hypothetical protein
MIIWIDCFGIQVDPLLVNGSLEPFLEGDAVLDDVPHIPMIWAE